MRKHKNNNLQLVRKCARIYLFTDILCFFKHFWGMSLGYIQSRDAFRLMASTYFFPRQDHPITGPTSQTRLECFVSQGLKLTRLVRISLSLEILVFNCKLNAEESTGGFPLTIMQCLLPKSMCYTGFLKGCLTVTTENAFDKKRN